MAITEKDIELQNTSYINKDFAQIYPEVLDLAKSLTSEWDPTVTNESDPGLVLIKLISFLGDKLNYNIDKNALEHFLPSATQDRSVRTLTSMLGYNMGYYKSAVVPIEFVYFGENSDISAPFTLSALDTEFTDDAGEIAYTLLEDLSVLQTGVKYSGKAIEGTINTLTVSDEAKIQLYHLDSEHRVFFPERMVASNGVFVSDDSRSWESVDNLNTVAAGEYVFEFGYDSNEKLPYVRFPDDIADLIGEGLTIRYIISSGADGTIAKQKLSTISKCDIVANSQSSGATLANDGTTDQYMLSNGTAIVEGEDPESIDSAYSNYKKTVGTFDTLVTARDYANYVYDYTTELGANLVSNAQVTDRRTDLFQATKVITYDPTSSSRHYIYYSEAPKDSTANLGDAFDLNVYAFKPITSYTKLTYNSSFELKDYTSDIEAAIDDSQCVCHNVRGTSDLKADWKDALLGFINNKKLNCTVYTKEKVGIYSENEILNNIYYTLYKNFNARGVDFGEDIPFDRIFDVIMSADDRIKTIVLDEPTDSAQAIVLQNGAISTKDWDDQMTSEVWNSANNISPKNYVLRKNILAGKIPAYDYYEGASVGFATKAPSQSGVSPSYDKIVSVTTAWAPTLSNGTELKVDSDNRVIQIISPSYSATTSYGIGVKYEFADDQSFKKNEVIKLSSSLALTWKDSDGEEQTKKLNAGTYVRFSFAKPAGKTHTMISGQTLEVLSQTKVELSDANTYLWWKLYETKDNERGKKLTDGYILKDGEVFVRKVSDFSIDVYGSGTTISIDNSNKYLMLDKTDTFSETHNVTASTIESALSEFVSDIDWKIFNLTSSKITLSENSILTLTNGCSLTVAGLSAGKTLSADFSKLFDGTSKPTSGSIKYKLSSDDSDTEFYSEADWDKYYIRSVLDLNCGPDSAQTLQANESLTLEYGGAVKSTATISGDGKLKMKSSSSLSVVGPYATLYATIQIGSSESDTQNVYPYSLFFYEDGTNGCCKDSAGNDNAFVSFPVPVTANGDLTIAVPSGVGVAMTLFAKGEGAKLTIGSVEHSLSAYSASDPKLNNIYVKSDNVVGNTLTLAFSGITADTGVRLLALKFVSGTTIGETILSNVFTSYPMFFSTADLDPACLIQPSYIETEDGDSVESYVEPDGLYDKNNVANKQTLTKIDLDPKRSVIKLAKQSKLQ